MATLRAKTSDSKVFIFSGLQDTERKDLAKKVSHLGAKYLDLKDFKRFCTHIITAKLTQSEKVLGGLATGKWILHPDYIQESFIAGCWLDEEQYEFCDERIIRQYPQADEELFFAPRRWRFMLGEHSSAFTGWKVAVIAGAKKAQVIKRLLISGGAEVFNVQLPIRRPDRVADTIGYVFVSEQNAAVVSSLIDFGVLCLRPEYIGDYLIKDPPPDIMDYIVQDTAISGYERTDGDTPDQDSFLMSTQTTFMSPTLSTSDHHTTSRSVEPKPSSSFTDNKPGSSSTSVHKAIENTDKDRENDEIEIKAADNTRKDTLSKRESRKSVRLKSQEGKGSPVWKSLIPRSKTPVNTETISHDTEQPIADDPSTVSTESATSIINNDREFPPTETDTQVEGVCDEAARYTSTINYAGVQNTTESVSNKLGVMTPDLQKVVHKPTKDFLQVIHDKEINKGQSIIELETHSKQSRKSVRLKAQDGNSPVWKMLIPRSKTPVMTEESAVQGKKQSSQDKIGSQSKMGLATFSPITKFFKPVHRQKELRVVVTDINEEVNKALEGTSQSILDNAGDAGDRKNICGTVLATSTPILKNTDGKTETRENELKRLEDTSGIERNKARAKKRLRTDGQAGKSLTEDKEDHGKSDQHHGKIMEISWNFVEEDKDMPFPPLKAAINSMKSDTTSSMKQWFGKFKDGYKKLVLGYEESKTDKQTSLNKSLSHEQVTESTVTIYGDDKHGDGKSEKSTPIKRKNDNLREVLLDLKRKKVSASEWVPSDYAYNQRENENTEDSICLTETSTEIIHSMLEEGYVMSALQQLRDRITFRCVPQAKTLYHLLFKILQNAKSDLEANTAYDVFMHVLRIHPPITPELQRLYLEMFSFKVEEEALVLNEWLLILEILYSVMQVEDSQAKRNSRLMWKIIKCLIQQNMQQFLLENAGKLADQGTRHLIMKIFWSPSYHVVFNTRCRQLLDAVLETIILYRAQTDGWRKSQLFELLQDMMWLVSMITETARLSVSGVRDGIRSLTTETISIFVHEISKRLIEADLNEPSLLNSIMSMLQLPWLCVGICQQILNTLDDYLLTDEQYLDMKIMSLTQIVKRYIFLLPRFHHELDRRQSNTSNCRQKKTEPLRCLNQNNEENHVDNGNLLKKANKKNAKGETPLHTACIRNDVTLVKSLLKVPGIDVNAQDNAGWTPLHEACNHGHIECVQELLKFVPSKTVDGYFTQVVTKRANMLAVNPEGITPLHDAVLNDRLEVSRLLLHQGGSKLLAMKTCLGYTALDFANSDEMYQMLFSFCQKRQRHSNSQDSSLIGSQGSQESSSSCNLPIEELYTEVLDHEGQKRYANMKYLRQYIHLILVLLQNYMKATSILTVVESLQTKLARDKESAQNQSSCENSLSVIHSGNMLGPSVSSEELAAVKEDLLILRKLPKHIEMFINHLLKMCLPEDSDQVVKDFTALQLFVDNITAVY